MSEARHQSAAPQRPPATMVRMAVIVPGALATSALTMLPGLSAGPSFDASVFLLIGHGIFQGERPYLDLWDHKPPLTSVIHGLSDVLFFWLDPWAAVWVVSVLAVAATGVITYAIARRGWPDWVAATAGLATVLGLGTYLVSLGGGMSETLAAPLLLGGIGLTLVVQPRPQRAFAAGILLACATIVSLQSIVAIGAVAAIAALAPGRRWLIALMVGGLIPLALVGAWLAAIGALPEAWRALVDYNAAYRAAGASVSDALWEQISRPALAATVLSLLYLVTLALYGLITVRRSPSTSARLTVIAALAWVTVAAAFGLYQGRFYTHYASVFVPPMALLSAQGIHALRGLAGRSVLRAGAVAAPWVLIAAISAVVAVELSDGLVQGERDNQAMVAEAATVIDSLSTPADPVFVWGLSPDIYLASNRRPLARWVYLLPLTTPGYSSGGQVSDLLLRFRKTPPPIVVDTGWGDGSALRFPFGIESQDGRDYDILGPVREFITTHYVRASVVGDWVVYRWKAGS